MGRGEIHPIRPGITRITPAQEKGSAWEAPNLYLVGNDPLTLIDAGYDRESDVELVLEAVGSSRLQRILLTHGHIDHAGGAWALRQATGCEVLLHAADQAAISRRFPGHEVDRTIPEGERIQAGEFSLELVLTPGHAPGHLAAWIENEGIFFSGDLVTGQGSTLVAPPEGNMKTYMESLRLVSNLPVKLLLPGHGPIPQDPRKRIAELIEHRELREICIYKCLAQSSAPLGLMELVRAMYAGLIHPQLQGAAAWTAWAHLEKMIEDKTVIPAPEGEPNPFHQTFSLAEGVREQALKVFC